MKYAVTGAGGFIGSHLAERLMNGGHEVIAIDLFLEDAPDNLAPIRGKKNLTLFKRNVCADLSDIFDGSNIDAVFHLAALPKVPYSIEHPLETHHANASGTVNVLETSRLYGVKRFVFSSSCAVYGDQEVVPFVETMSPRPNTPYALHKLIGEQCAALYHSLYGLETISLRYFNVFGPRQDHRGDYANLFGRFITRLATGVAPIINGDGTHTRDYVHVSDVVSANILAAETNNADCFGQTMNIGSGRGLSINDIAKHILALHPSTIAPVHAPPVVETAHAVANYEKAQRLLGWEPTTSFSDVLPETVDYFSRAATHAPL